MGALKKRKDLAESKGEPWPPAEPERKTPPKTVLQCANCGRRRPNAVLPVMACPCGDRRWLSVRA